MKEPYEIVCLGNPILRQKTEAVHDINSPEIKEIIDRMMATIHKLGGLEEVAGLAAPQVGISLSIFIMQSNNEFVVIINPEIIYHNQEKGIRHEGCFSLPHLLGDDIERYKIIRCRYTTTSGELIETDLEEFDARVFQHEYDHLFGILYIDHAQKLYFNSELKEESENQYGLIFDGTKKEIQTKNGTIEIFGVKESPSELQSMNYNPQTRQYEKLQPTLEPKPK